MVIDSSLTSPTTCILNPCRDKLTPALVQALADKHIVTVSGGWRHTLAADSQGVVYGWGWNKVRAGGRSSRWGTNDYSGNGNGSSKG